MLAVMYATLRGGYMLKVTRTGQAKAKKLLSKLITEEEYKARNPSANDLEIYRKIKRELELGAKEGFISKITTVPDSKTKQKRTASKNKTNDLSKNPYKGKLTPADVKSLCDAADKAWSMAGPRKKICVFEWRGKKFQTKLTGFRMVVETLKGEPVAARFH